MKNKTSSQGLSPLMWLGLMGSALFFVLISLVKINQPVSQDELWSLVAAKTFLSSGKPLCFSSPECIQAYHPHLYLLSIITTFKCLGVNDAIARLPGVFAGVLSIILIFIAVDSFSSGSLECRLRWAILMSLLYALSPMPVQGAIIIDIDNTVLIPFLLFLCFAFFKYVQKRSTVWGFLTSLAVMVALWTKLTTSMAMIIVFAFLSFMQKGNQKSKFITISTLLAGIAAFVASWYLYCTWNQIPFNQPFVYLLSSFINKSTGLRGMQFLQNILYFVLWSGVAFIFLIMMVLKHTAINLSSKWEFRPEYGYLIAALVIMIGYSVIGGATFGFPKYQSPSIAMVYIAVALLLSRDHLAGGPSFKVWLFLFLTAFIFQFFIIGDLIYVARYTLRKTAVFSPDMYNRELQAFIIMFCIPILAYSGCIAYMRRFGKSWLLMTTIILMLGANTALTFRQATAPYHTGYSYGAEGTRETIDYILRTVPRESTIIAPSEVIYYVNPQPPSYQFDFIWNSPREIAKQLNSQKVSCFAYSIASNTVNQVRLINLDRTITDILRRRYSHVTIGSYDIWVSNKY